MMPNDSPKELTSWKEIASHLDVTVRTAQEWEKKRGLPVRRVPGGRGRVFMRLDELEAWLTRGGLASAFADADPSAVPDAPRPRLSLLALAGAVAALVVVVAAALIARSGRPALSGPETPSQWRVTRDNVVISNEDGEELWRKQFDQQLHTVQYEDPVLGEPQFVDIDGDGKLETLFLARFQDFTVRSALICFDARGEELWRYAASAAIRTARESFEDIYQLEAFLPVDLSNGEKAVVVSSVHYSLYPTQIALISAIDGQLLQEYWHTGHIGNRPDRLAVGDHNGDGRQELYALGISNSYDRATLVVLDFETMKGASVEENPAYQFEGFEAPNEVARILFPRSSMSARADDYNIGAHVWLTPEFINVAVLESISDSTKPQLIYRLRSDFSQARVDATTAFEGAHKRLVQENVLTISLEEEMASLLPLQYVGPGGVLLSRQ